MINFSLSVIFLSILLRAIFEISFAENDLDTIPNFLSKIMSLTELLEGVLIVYNLLDIASARTFGNPSYLEVSKKRSEIL